MHIESEGSDFVFDNISIHDIEDQKTIRRPCTVVGLLCSRSLDHGSSSVLQNLLRTTRFRNQSTLVMKKNILR